jgi:hypothetical protein
MIGSVAYTAMRSGYRPLGALVAQVGNANWTSFKGGNEMATAKQKRALVQPKGRRRVKPGTKGEGDYFRIVVRTKDEFTMFRYQDVGEKGHILRLAGKRSSGSWNTQAWLIGKNDAHIKGNALIADTHDAKKVIKALGSKP